MDDYDFARRQSILASGDTVEERLSAGADIDELMGLDLLGGDDDVGVEPEGEAETPSEDLDSENFGNSLSTSDSEIDLTGEF